MPPAPGAQHETEPRPQAGIELGVLFARWMALARLQREPGPACGGSAKSYITALWSASNASDPGVKSNHCLMGTSIATPQQQAFALTPASTKHAVLPSLARRTNRTVEDLAHVARAKANGGNVHTVNQIIGLLRYWCYIRPHVKSRAAQHAATCNAIECALKLRAFIVTGRITL